MVHRVRHKNLTHGPASTICGREYAGSHGNSARRVHQGSGTSFKLGIRQVPKAEITRNRSCDGFHHTRPVPDTPQRMVTLVSNVNRSIHRINRDRGWGVESGSLQGRRYRGRARNSASAELFNHTIQRNFTDQMFLGIDHVNHRGPLKGDRCAILNLDGRISRLVQIYLHPVGGRWINAE